MKYFLQVQLLKLFIASHISGTYRTSGSKLYELFLKGMGIIHLEPRKEETAMKEQTYYLMRGMIRPIVKTMT